MAAAYGDSQVTCNLIDLSELARSTSVARPLSYQGRASLTVFERQYIERQLLEEQLAIETLAAEILGLDGSIIPAGTPLSGFPRPAGQQFD